MIRIVVALTSLVALAGAASAQAVTLQTLGNFDRPMYVGSPPGEPNRILVAERAGRIEQLENGVRTTFADLVAKTRCCLGEQGLQSFAFAPDFQTSGRLYVAYTDEASQLVVAEMRTAAGGRSAPTSSLREIIAIPHPIKDNHYGGQLQIGPEGLLFISTGDGGGRDDELENAQNPESLLGKVLRLEPTPAGFPAYTVPFGNPFPGATAPYDTIWSLGLRNPYRFSFDASGGLWIGDVGQDAIEEVDYAPLGAPGGANYGWSCREGTLPGPSISDPECATPPPGGYIDPVFQYPHTDPEDGSAHGCAIIGGYVVRDRSLGDLFGRYLYGDFCAGELRSFSPFAPAATDRAEGIGVAQQTSFGEDSCGRLYVTGSDGLVARLVGDPVETCAPDPPAIRRLSFVGIKAVSRKVQRRKRAQITAWVSPCAGRRGQAVRLLRGRTVIGTRRLDVACSVRFRPRITRKVRFRATIAEDLTYVAATSRKLAVKVRHKPRQRRAQ